MAIKAGPKAPVTADPLDLSDLPTSRAERRIAFIERFVTVPKGVGGGELVELRSFQLELILGAYAEGIRTALVSMPRANGKTALAAMLAVAELFAGPMSAEVLVVASDQRQAGITFNLARRIIELNPELASRVHVYKDKIVVPENDATLIPLPADPAALHGWDPALLIVDELHVVTPAVWEAITSVTGKRPESLTLAISTPAESQDSIMWSLVEHGREGSDPAFYLKEFAAPAGCATDDRKAWLEANPALSCDAPFLAEDGLASARRTLREQVFRQLRLGQWVASSDSWLPFGAFDEIRDTDRRVSKREKVVLAFDGSASGDSTALIGCTVADPHLFVLGLWEKEDDPRWRVPRGDVDRAVELAFHDYNVVEFAADPWGWRSEIEAWAKRFGERKVVEYNTGHAKRMAPATDRLYQAVVEHHVTHDGNADLARHFEHTVARRTPMGDLVQKEKQWSPRKIDAAVASIIAHDRAAWHANNKKTRKVVTFK